MDNNRNKTNKLTKGNKLAILFMSLLVAVSLCVTGAVLSTDRPVSVDTPTAGEVESSTTYSNKEGDVSRTLQNGDIINYSYVNNKIYSVTLGKGTYDLEVWGAQGGSYSSGNGGKGGYSKGRYTVTGTTQTLYIVVGGTPTYTTSRNAYLAGGYNGGGRGRGYGQGGGGATHIATQYGLLRNISSGNAIIVAGGGGGAQAGAGGYGAGGNNNGGTGTDRCGSPGIGGKTNGVGTAGTNGTSTSGGYSRINPTSGGFGYGGDAGQGSDAYGGGGGGGGWYGGGGGGSDHSLVDDSGGGGGSGYIKNGLTNTSSSNGARASHGSARITAVSVNQAPTSKNATVATTTRGNGKNISVSVSSVAQDANSGQTIHFSAGSSNRDTMPGANQGLWVNSSTLATNYVDWDWPNNTTLRIKNFKRYPRAGVDGMSANGKLTLYCYVRDSYGTTTTRGITKIAFHITVNDQGVSIINTSNNTSGTDVTVGGNYVQYSYGSGANAYHYRLGASNNTSQTYDYQNNPGIYNKSNGKQTVFVPEPLTPARSSAGFTIYARDLYKDLDSTYDEVGIKSVSTDSNSAYYSITYNKNTAKYGSTGLAESITIKPTSARPTRAVFAVLTITAQECESASKAVIGSNNTSLQLAFKIANTRPYFAATSTSVYNTGLSEPVITLQPGKYQDIPISSIAKDIDGNTMTYAMTNNASSIKVPTNEFVPVTLEGNAIALQNTSNYYNQGAKTTSTPTTGEGNQATGFNSDARRNTNALLALAGSAAASKACVTYSFVNNTTLRLTGRAATHYQYNDDNRKGDFYIMVRVIDAGDSTDTGIWFPIAIKVEASKPTSPSTVANFTLGYDDVITNTTPEGSNSKNPRSNPHPIYLTPISYMSGNTLKGVGSVNEGDYADVTRQVQPFATDGDAYSFGQGSGIDSSSTVECAYRLNDIIVLDTRNGANPIVPRNTENFFTVETIDLYAAPSVFTSFTSAQLERLGITPVTRNGNIVCYKFKGLKITPKSGTNNNFYQFDVKVTDSHVTDPTAQNTAATIPVYIKVENRAVSVRRAADADNTIPFRQVDNDITFVDGNNSLGTWYMNYRIEKYAVAGDEIYITPYDLAYDPDNSPTVNADAANGTFNSNPALAGWATAKNAILQTYSVLSTSAPSIKASAANVTYNQLRFGGEASFNSAVAQFAGYISAEMTEKDGVPCIVVKGVSRTSANIPVLRFTVTDGFTSVDCAIGITVSNSAPYLTVPSGKYYKLTAGTADTANDVMNALEFTVGSLVADKDTGDIPTFMPGTVRTVAYVGGEYAEYIKATTADGIVKYVKSDASDPAAVKISDYVYATLAKSTDAQTLGVDVIRVEARSSTQLFDVPVFFEFQVTDGYRADPRTSTLRVQVEVMNSAPQFAPTDLVARENEETGGTDYVWSFSFKNLAEKAMPRYIVNDVALYNSTAIPTTAVYKKLLFNDADARQTVLLHGSSATLVGQYTGDGIITANDFGDNAVVYGKTYADTIANNYLQIEIEYYQADANGVFSKITNAGVKSEYWAIKIIDKANTSADALSTQIAIAIKDNHHGAAVYDGSRDVDRAQTGSSSFNILNLRYEYQPVGLVAMHDVYRTDGYGDSYVPVVNESGESTGKYAVDSNSVEAYQFKENRKPNSQDEMRSLTFIDDFKYQYFVDTVTKTTGSGDNVETSYSLTSKHYAPSLTSAFFYKPIEVMDTGNTDVPLSYLAMPAIININGTGNGAYVKLADTTSGRELSNVTLSDGTTSWGAGTDKALSENPYINIEYLNERNFVGSETYRNTKRFILTSDTNPEWQNDKYDDGNGEPSPFVEDRTGFRFTKKGDKRPAGSLRLTVKMTTSGENSKIEDVGVDIKVQDARFALQKMDNKSIGIDMTMSDTAGKSVRLSRDGAHDANTIGITYVDNDSNDVLKFYMPTASKSALSSTLSDAEIDHLNKSDMCADASAYVRYFGTAKTEGFTDVIKAHVPNRGYDKFFDVSPVSGASSVLQFIPKAKTDLNLVGDLASLQGDALATKLKTEYNLETETVGGKLKIYYPFKVIVYDDLENMGLTNGYWDALTIKVYIGNDAPAYTDKNQSPITLSDGHNYNHYDFSLTKGVNFTVDVTSLINDSDMALNGLSYQTTPIAGESAYTGDYLQMPVVGAGSDARVDYTIVARRGGTPVTELPFDVTPAADSPSSIVFGTENAFKTEVLLLLSFKDTSNTELKLVFAITYNNENPTANADTYRGGALNITMTHGDSFMLHAADASKFAPDTTGGYLSPAAFGSTQGNKWLVDAKHPTSDGYSATDYRGGNTSAATMYGNFGFMTEIDYEKPEGGKLGSLILGSDDAASTLRFNVGASSPVLFDNNDGANFTVTACDYLATEASLENGSNYQYLPMSVKIVATGVISNARMRLVLTDGSNPYTVELYVTVLSTPPVAKTDGLPAGLTVVNGEQNTYALNLNYGDVWEQRLSRIATDVDTGDDNYFAMPAVYDGLVAGVTGAASAVTAEQDADRSGFNTLKITATDYISTADENNYALVKFRINDRHGMQSEEIKIRVYVSSHDAESLATATNIKPVAVKSYKEFADDGVQTTIALISDGSNVNTTIIADIDVNAPSALYDVEVYGLYKETDNGVEQTTVDSLNFDKALIVKRIQRHGDTAGVYTYGSGKIYEYVNGMFGMEISEDGKQLIFTPVASTIASAGNAPRPVALFVRVSKNCTSRSEDGTVSYTKESVGAYLNATVANSLPVAVPSSGLNYGYPQIPTYDGDENTIMQSRDSDFLAFSGSAGDSLTWNLYDTADRNHGLFYDYDMLNMIDRQGKNIGNEQLVYVSGKVAESYVTEDGETKTTPRDALLTSNPVLSVVSDDANHTVSININRKVFTGQSSATGSDTSTVIPVEITCADILSYRAGNISNYVKTVILVTVNNDVPEFKTVTLDESGRRYQLTYSEASGYNLYATVRYNESLTISLRDIIEDQDFNMDSYSLVGGDGFLTSKNQAIYGDMLQSERLFNFTYDESSNDYDVSTIRSIMFKGISAKRGATATTKLRFTDSTRRDKTSELNVHLTVGNTAPAAKNPVTELTIMGAKRVTAMNNDGVEEDISPIPDPVTFNIIDYVTDINGDAVNALTSDGHKTYVYINEIRTDERYEYSLFGPRVDADSADGIETTLLCDVNWYETETDPQNQNHQGFGITVVPGVYGTQYFVLTVEDGGYIAGMEAGVSDSLTCQVIIKVTVACPIAEPEEGEDLPSFDIASKVKRTVTPSLLLDTEEVPNASAGYTIKSITSTGSAVTVFSPEEDETRAASAWRIVGNYVSSEKPVITVTFDVGGLEVVRDFAVNVTNNNAPRLKEIENIGIYQVSQLVNNTITIRPEDWFIDDDVEDVMAFRSPIKVQVGAYANVKLSGDNLVITFLGRGSTDLTFNITDSTGVLYTKTIEIGCSDMAELNGWNSMIANIQRRPLIYGIVFGAVLLLILLIIIISVVVSKKRKMRREIEALLASENELNEEMMRLSASTSMSAQPFAYLAPTPAAVNDPGLMIGSSQPPVTNSLQLGAGTGQNIGTSMQALPSGQSAQQTPPQQQRPPVRPAQPQQQRPAQPQQPQRPYGQTQQPYPRTAAPQQQRPPYPQTQQPQRPQAQYPKTNNAQNKVANDGFDPDSF